MKHLLRRPAPSAGLLGTLALLALATSAHAQAPTVIYGLGTVVQDYTPSAFLPNVTYKAGTQALAMFNPASDGNSPAITTVQAASIVGITVGQQLVGIDVRPSTGVLYALGFDKSKATANAQLYTLVVTTESTISTIGTATLTAVGGALTLNLADTNTSNTVGLLPNVGFDFNPRVDRIRVVATNGANYRLNPNVSNGIVGVTTDKNLNYGNTTAVPAPANSPYVGTVAYTNSQLGLTGTTLYDIDVTVNNAVLSVQAPPNDGTLTTKQPVKFSTDGGATSYGITSPTIGLGLDIYSAGSANVAYLVEARYQNSSNTPGSYTSNLYTFDLTSGVAVRKFNIVGGKPIFFSDIAVALPAPTTWLGVTSNAWNEPTNWSNGAVPTSTSNVFIPGPSNSVRYQPIVSDPNEAVNSITLGNGAVLTTADGGVLSVTGNFVNNDGTVAGSGSGTVALAGTGAHEIAGGASSNFRNLSVGSGGATTTAPVSVEQGLTLTGSLTLGAGATAGSTQPFTLLSNSTTGTAYVVDNGGTIVGPATVQRYIDGSLNQGTGYRHFSSPVQRTTLGAALTTGTYTPAFNTDYNGSTAPGTVRPFPTVFGYSQSQYESSPATTITTDFDRGYYSPEAGTAWTPGTGYTVNIPSTELVSFVGTVTTGNVSTAPQGRSSKLNAGWQLLGNPYPSALDWDVVAGRKAPAGGQASSGLSGLNDAVYVFKSSGQYAGTYATYVNGVGANNGTNVIPLGQGFLVRTVPGGSGSLNFTNGQRIAGPTTATLQRTTADGRPLLRLELSSATAAAQTAVYFESGATAGLDATYDAEALPFLNGLLLASVADASLLSVNGLPALVGTATVPLRVAVATAGTYTLRVADLDNLPTGYRAYLRDAQLGTTTDLSATPSVQVSLAAGPATTRFTVIISPTAPLATAPAALAALATVYPNPAHGTAVLLLPTALRGQAASEVQVLNTLGQVVLHRTVAAGGSDQISLPLSGLAAGTYTVRATTANGSVAKQLVVE